VGEKIGAGPINVITSAKEIESLRGRGIGHPDDRPGWEPIMKIAAGIVTDRGGRTCHAAIISRELAFPAWWGQRMEVKF